MHRAGDSADAVPPAAASEGAARELARWRRGEPAREGYFVPCRHAAQVPPPAPAWLHALLDAALPRMGEWLQAARAHAPTLRAYARGRAGDPHGPRYDQDWFTGLDATLAYTATRLLAPAQILEVGSGHSTRFLARAARDAGATTRLVSIDPQPRRGIDHLCDAVHRAPLGADALPLFATLGSTDLLFVDGSHVLMPGSDVDLLLGHVLPVLPAGCVVHMHDVFLPDEYPSAWRWRGYNEQSALRALLGTGRFELLAASAWLRRYHPGLLGEVFAPCTAGAFESSLWLRVRGLQGL